MNSESPSENNPHLKSNSLLVFAVAVVISVIASFMIQEKYRSTVTMFAAATNSIGRSFMKEDNREDLMELGDTEQAEQLLQLVNSQEVQDYVIHKYNLFEHYNIKPNQRGANSLMSKAYKENINASLTKFGSIDVEVLDTSPDTAMLIANDIAAMVDTVSNRLKNERARQALEMAQAEYRSLLLEIEQMETDMGELRELGIFDFGIQIDGLNEQYATAVSEGRIKQAEIIKKEMQEISKYGSQYQRLKTLIESSYDREAVLKGNYELLRVDVASTIPAKFVVNRGQVPDKKAYPVRWLIVVMSFISAFVFTVILLLVFENFRRMKREELI
jgi:uncharacterized protein involved in exopolysaccharide biosynthesis